MTPDPLTSVVIPTRNRSHLLGLTLRSVLRQRDVRIEVIVVDEASDDDTMRMLTALRQPRVRVVHHATPRGVSAARNSGIAAAEGTWIAFLDDDDVWAPDKLASQLRAAHAAGRDWAYTGSVTFAEPFHVVHGAPPPPPESVVEHLRHYNAIPGGGSNVIVRRSTLLRAGPFDPRLRNTEDWEMWLRLAEAGPPAWVPRPLVAYRVHPSNASLDIAQIVAGTRLIERMHDTTADWGALHRWFAESCLRQGRRAAALMHLVRAARHGCAAGVATDLGALARRRLGTLVRRDLAPSGDQDWMRDAAAWLRDLHEERHQ